MILDLLMYALLTVLAVWVVARLISAAYFKSRKDYEQSKTQPKGR